MTTIHISPAALEAGARAAYDQWRHECADEADEPVENWREWDDLDEFEQDSFRAQARAAFEAMVENWPGMLTERRARCDAVVLPYNLDADLPQENSDD